MPSENPMRKNTYAPSFELLEYQEARKESELLSVHPNLFLKYAAWTRARPEIMKPRVIRQLAALMQAGEKLDPTWLFINRDKYGNLFIQEHEGRHRALAAKGIRKNIPLMLHFGHLIKEEEKGEVVKQFLAGEVDVQSLGREDSMRDWKSIKRLYEKVSKEYTKKITPKERKNLIRESMETREEQIKSGIQWRSNVQLYATFESFKECVGTTEAELACEEDMHRKLEAYKEVRGEISIFSGMPITIEVGREEVTREEPYYVSDIAYGEQDEFEEARHEFITRLLIDMFVYEFREVIMRGDLSE